MKKPNFARRLETCQSLTEVQQHLDALDEQLLPLLCERLRYAVQAARFKTQEHEIRQLGRIEAMVCRGKAYANALQVNEDSLEAIYRQLLDECTREEKRVWVQSQKMEPNHE